MNRSYVHGTSDKQLIGQTIGQFFDAACDRHADRDALVVRHQNVRLTYRALRDKVDAVACALIRLNLKPGDRVGIWSPNRHEWVLVQYAAARIGAALKIDGGCVGQEEEVELAALGKLRRLHHVGKAGAGTIMRFGMAPGSDMLAGFMHEGPEMHRPLVGLCGHASPSRATADNVR